MEINQNNQHGNNTITFSTGANFKHEEIKSFKNPDSVREFYKRSKRAERIAYLIAVLTFLLAPFYDDLIRSFFK